MNYQPGHLSANFAIRTRKPLDSHIQVLWQIEKTLERNKAGKVFQLQRHHAVN